MRTFLSLFLLSLAASAQEPPAAPDPDVQRIHVLEKRPFTEAGRWELSFFGLTQVNPKFTVHTGVSVEAAYHLRENLAAQLGFTFFPIAVQSTLTEELLNKAGEAPTSAEAFLLRYDAVAGLELMPIYGKLNILDGQILRLGFYLNAGLGLARTRLQLRPSTDPTTGRSFGDAGFRPLAQLGVGIRVFASERFTIRIELRDFAYSGFTSTVNGCNKDDTKQIQTANDLGQSPTVSSGCDPSSFGSPGPQGTARLNAAGAYDLLRNPSAEVINNIAFQGGISWLF
jgi:outer membrane beta-barrel protein